jgi:hypothetical protein
MLSLLVHISNGIPCEAYHSRLTCARRSLPRESIPPPRQCAAARPDPCPRSGGPGRPRFGRGARAGRARAGSADGPSRGRQPARHCRERSGRGPRPRAMRRGPRVPLRNESETPERCQTRAACRQGRFRLQRVCMTAPALALGSPPCTGVHAWRAPPPHGSTARPPHAALRSEPALANPRQRTPPALRPYSL